MDVRLREIAAAHADLVAAWQLMRAGWSASKIEYWAARHCWRQIHDGVYALTHAPLTQRQLWMAATLTTPSSTLSHASAGACWGFMNSPRRFETVTRPGSGGRRLIDGVFVARSRLLDGETTALDGIAITCAARTLIDLAAGLHPLAVGRAVREGLRLKALTARELAAGLERHRGRRGTRVLWELAERYSSIPYTRTRSNAEARALEVLHDAGLMPAKVNARIAGEEADLIWPDRRRIIEIDGPQFHQFSDEDERKQRCWEAAGYTVRRIPSQTVYDSPAALISLAST